MELSFGSLNSEIREFISCKVILDNQFSQMTHNLLIPWHSFWQFGYYLKNEF